MSLPSLSRASRRPVLRRAVGALGALGLALAGVLVPAAPAGAATGPFSIDGTVDASTTDIPITELPDEFGSAKELGPKNASTTKIGTIHTAAPPMLELTNPNGQVDLRRAWLGTGRDTNTNKDWLYFAWERDSNSGSGVIAYEFMQKPVPAGCTYPASIPATSAEVTSLKATCNPWANRSAGDFVILWSVGSSTPFALRKWATVGDKLVLGAPEPGGIPTNLGEAAYSADGSRGEAAINLTDAVFGGSTACVAYANTLASTVTGNSDTADYKDTILKQAPPIANCRSEVVTTPKTGTGADIPDDGLSIGTGVVAVTDSARVSVTGGNAVPAGSVSFSLCKVESGTTCIANTSVPVGSTPLSGTSYPATVTSPTAYVTAAGRYCWSSVFSGDAPTGIPGDTDNSPEECFSVNAVTPTLSTTAGADVLVGGAVTDAAVLGGTATQPADPIINTTGASGPAAGGTITFKLYGPDSCSTLEYTSSAVAVSGNNTYNTPAPPALQSTPDLPGEYSWVATYSGSPNTIGITHNADCADTAEDVVVSTVDTSLSTAQSWVPNDSMTVSAGAGGDLLGTATFTLYASADCEEGTEVFTEDVAVAGVSGTTVSTSNEDAVDGSGSYSWGVSYANDNPAHEDIGFSCEETSDLTVDNGSAVGSGD